MTSPDSIIKEGSSLYYSLLWIKPEQRQRVIRQLALINTISTTLHDVQEPQVAQRKIHWWHEELTRLQHAQARHPEVKACEPTLHGSIAAQEALLAILSVASEERFSAAPKSADTHKLIAKDYTARLALISHALSNRHDDLALDTHAANAALALGLHEKLARLPSLIHRGLPVFSDELYQRFNIRPSDLAQHIRLARQDNANETESTELENPTFNAIPIVEQKPGRKALLIDAVSSCLQSFNEAIACEHVRSRYQTEPLLPIWRLLILRQSQLALWSEKHPDLLRERMSLTPLTKLYKAWRNRR